MAKLGKWITIISIAMMALCTAPILLYAAFGPEDGNPIGLGLLFFFGAPIFAGAAAIGAAMWIIAIVRATFAQSKALPGRKE